MPARKTVRKKNAQNNHTTLDAALVHLMESVAALNQTQAMFNQNLALVNQQIAQTNAEIAQIRAETRELQLENAERFARIEQLLLKHEFMLQELPEAIRQKIGFQK
jgi:hypothetical protein